MKREVRSINTVKQNTERVQIAFVCDRYGSEVNGGAEYYCRQLAEKLTAYYDVTVYTTCAVDYKSWRNEYSVGSQLLGGVHIKRYLTKRIRRRIPFALFSRYVTHVPFHTKHQESQWVDAQGPYCPALIQALREEQKNYRAILFMTYLYYPTVRGIQVCPEKSILIPTVHDERPVYLRCFDTVFKNAKAIAWNTQEERAFAYKRFPNVKVKPGEITGIGIDVPKRSLPELPDRLRGKKYILYVGRIDNSKGCGKMFDYFLRYKRNDREDLKLVLIGKPVMKIPQRPDIMSLGFVSEEMKFSLMQNSVALVLFSPFESLSIVVLESMMMEKPVLVTGHCDVLKGHCIRSNAGLYFYDYVGFEGALNYLISHPDQYEVMQRNGKKYVAENYKWNIIIEKYRRLIEQV